MRVKRTEVVFSGNQENDSPDSRQSAIAARLAPGGQKQAVQGFEEAVGHAAAGPGDDAPKVGSDHPCDIVHRLDLLAHDARAPLPEHVADDVDLLAVEDLAQVFPILPGARGTLRRQVCEQGAQTGTAGCDPSATSHAAP